MFQVFKRKKNNTPELTVELIIDAPVYEQLKNRAHAEGVSENDVFEYSLKRGMSDYWLHVVKYERERYQSVKKLFSQSKRDNELLEAIINQNERFHEILDDKDKQGEIQ
jgi:hypothetical protein